MRLSNVCWLTALFLTLISTIGCKEEQADILAEINQKKAEIDKNLKAYTYRYVDDIVSEDRGVIGGYYDEEQIIRIAAQYFNVNGRRFVDYYFDDGMLIFVHEASYKYNKPNTYTEEVARQNGDSIWYDDAKTTSAVNTYYFNENKLIKYKIAASTSPADTTVNLPIKEAQLLAQALLSLRQLHEWDVAK